MWPHNTCMTGTCGDHKLLWFQADRNSSWEVAIIKVCCSTKLGFLKSNDIKNKPQTDHQKCPQKYFPFLDFKYGDYRKLWHVWNSLVITGNKPLAYYPIKLSYSKNVNRLQFI